MEAEFYRTRAPVVRAYLRHFVPGQDVDDVTQVVFTEAWRSWHRYDPARSLNAWLLGIARNRAIDHLRRRPPPGARLDDAPSPRDGLAALDERDRLDRALARLPGPQRQAIELAYYGDLTQREIAERLRVPLGTVKARTARGLHRMASLLDAP